MFKCILLCTLLAHSIWAKPVHEHTDLTPHVLIVTPQAQVRLDSLIPGTPIIQHLSPVTRFIAPHEETIVYVPASALAGNSVEYAEIIARSLPSGVARQDLSQQISQIAQTAAQTAAQSAASLISGSFAPGDVNPATILQGALESAPGALSQAAAAAGSSLASGASSFAPGDWPSALSPLVQGAITNAPIVLGSAANAATAAATAAGSGFVSGLTQSSKLSSVASESKSSSSSSSLPSSLSSLEPSPLPLPALSSASLSSSPSSSSLPSPLPLPGLSSASSLSSPSSSSLPKIEKIQYEIPITPIVLTEPRHHYIIAPAPGVPHVVDFVQGPILLAPALNTIHARNLQAGDKEKPVITIPLPELLKPEALPLSNDLEREALIKDIEKKADFKRFLEANALKEDLKENALNLNQIKAAENQKNEKPDLEKTELELKPAPIINEDKDEEPQAKVA